MKKDILKYKKGQSSFELSRQYLKKERNEEAIIFFIEYIKNETINYSESAIEFTLEILLKMIELRKYEETIYVCNQLLNLKDKLADWEPAIRSSLGIAYGDLGNFEKANYSSV